MTKFSSLYIFTNFRSTPEFSPEIKYAYSDDTNEHQLTGLRPATFYEIRVWVENSAGISVGSYNLSTPNENGGT